MARGAGSAMQTGPHRAICSKSADHSSDNSGTPRRSRNAATQLAKKPSRDFDAAAALGILWVVAMPTSAQANTPFAVMVHAHKFAVIARDLVRIGMLRRVRVRQGGHWEDGYELAPLQEPLDRGHSELVRQITDRMLEHPDDRIVAELRAVSRLLPKLLRWINHPDKNPA